MAEDLCTQFFSSISTPQRHLSQPRVVRLDEDNTKEPILLHPEETMKRTRSQIIALSENKRRTKMRQLFFTLQSLLPVSTTQKLARHDIIEETCKYIKNLQYMAQELQKRKAHLLMDHNSSATDVSIEIYDNEKVIIRITSSRMPRSLSKIHEVVEARGLEIERADVYRGESIVFLYLQAAVNMSLYYYETLQSRQTRTCLKLNLENIY